MRITREYFYISIGHVENKEEESKPRGMVRHLSEVVLQLVLQANSS